MKISVIVSSKYVSNETQTIVTGFAAVHKLATWQYVKINTTISSNDNDDVTVQIVPMIENEKEQGFWAVGDIRNCSPLGENLFPMNSTRRTLYVSRKKLT